MRNISSLHPTEGLPMAPDTTQTLLIAGSSGQAADWAGGTPNLVRVTARSTAGAAMSCEVNLESTKALAPSSGHSTLGSSANVPVLGQGTLQVPGTSTGFSVASLSSGYVTLEQWHR